MLELAIVFVVLALLLGGVVAGKSLIHAAEIRSTIAQVDNLKVAARTFREKYFYLPGDIPTSDATRLNLGKYSGAAGNGNGLITSGYAEGEINLFFVHLAQKGLIEGAYTVLGVNENTDSNGKKVSDYVLKAKMGGDLYIHAYSGGPGPCFPSGTCNGSDGINYLSLGSASRYCHFNICGKWGTFNTMATTDASVIDNKVDDGMPQSGGVQAFHLRYNSAGAWAGGEYYGRGMHTYNSAAPSTAANAAGATNCYDNGGVAGQPQRYTTSRDNNTCALSFRL